MVVLLVGCQRTTGPSSSTSVGPGHPISPQWLGCRAMALSEQHWPYLSAVLRRVSCSQTIDVQLFRAVEFFRYSGTANWPKMTTKKRLSKS